MSLSNDEESKDLAISLFWTSEYVKDNNIIPELRMYVTNKKGEGPRSSIGYYLNEKNVSRHANFSSILDDLIHDQAYFFKEH